MALNLVTLAIFLGSIYPVLKGIDWIFNQDDVIKKGSKESLGKWLANADYPEGLEKWPIGFTKLFDRWFGKKHLSWKCFLRSSLVSIVGVALFFLIEQRIQRPLGLIRLEMGTLVIITLLINIIPDYVSLLETRVILDWIHPKDSASKQFLILFLDTVLTFFVFVAGLHLVDTLFYEITGGNLMVKIMGTFSSMNPLFNSMWVFIYTTFLTSVWLWLYIGSSWLIKLIGLTRPGIRFLQRHLDLENKPFKSLGKVVQLFALIGYVIAGLWMWVF